MSLPVSNGVGLSTVSLAEFTFTLPKNPRDNRRDDVVKLLDKLDVLAQQSDPVHGPETTAGKDTKAYFALQVAGALIYNLAGWALQHRYGLALDQGLSPWPEHADNRDSHNHEMRGVTQPMCSQ